jgi:hypothetical protein
MFHVARPHVKMIFSPRSTECDAKDWLCFIDVAPTWAPRVNSHSASRATLLSPLYCRWNLLPGGRVFSWRNSQADSINVSQTQLIFRLSGICPCCSDFGVWTYSIAHGNFHSRYPLLRLFILGRCLVLRAAIGHFLGEWQGEQIWVYTPLAVVSRARNTPCYQMGILSTLKLLLMASNLGNVIPKGSPTAGGVTVAPIEFKIRHSWSVLIGDVMIYTRHVIMPSEVLIPVLPGRIGQSCRFNHKQYDVTFEIDTDTLQSVI